MQLTKTLSSLRHWKVSFLSMLLSLCMTAAFAQQGAIKGKILDENGELVPT